MAYTPGNLAKESKAKNIGTVNFGAATPAAASGGSAASAGLAPANPNYLRETRESDPWPLASATTVTAKVQMISARFGAPTGDMRLWQPVRVSCNLKILADTRRGSVEIKLQSNLPQHQDRQVGWLTETTVTARFTPGTAGSEQQVDADIKLLTTNAQYGDTVEFRLSVKHVEANDEILSEVVSLVHKITVRFVEVPDILFHLGSPLPSLDPNGWLVNSLATAIAYARDEAPRVESSPSDTKLKEQLVVFGHADTSGHFEPNYTLSEKRGQAMKALLDNDVDTWEILAKSGAKDSDWKQTLQSLRDSHGWPCDPSKPSSFQKEANRRYNLGLKEDGLIGPKSWRAIHRVIFGLVASRLGLEDPATSAHPEKPRTEYGYPQGNGVYGCGESFPIEAAGRNDFHSESNRRVELVFLAVGTRLDPPPIRNRNLTGAECPCYDNTRAIKERIASKAFLDDILCLAFPVPYGPDLSCQATLLDSRTGSRTLNCTRSIESNYVEIRIPKLDNTLRYSLRLQFGDMPPQWFFRNAKLCNLDLGMPGQVTPIGERPQIQPLMDLQEHEDDDLVEHDGFCSALLDAPLEDNRVFV